MAPPFRKRKPQGLSTQQQKKPKQKQRPPQLSNDAPLDISSLYETIVVDFEHRFHSTHAASSSFVSTEQVWNTLGRIHAETNKEGITNEERANATDRFSQASEIFAVLVTRDDRCSLDFVNDASLFSKVTETVLQPMLSNANNDESAGYWYSLSTMVHFCDKVWMQAQTNATLISPDLMLHAGASLAIWYWMPERRRTLELKQRDLEMDYEKAISGLDKDKTPMVIFVVEALLRLLQGNQLKMHGDKMSTTDNDDDDNEDDNDTDEASLHLHQWIFVHRALEILIDVLGITQSQRRVSVYLQSMHFCLQCRLVLGVSTFSKAEENMFLAQQLLERIDKLLKQYPVVHSTSRGHDKQYVSLSSTEQQALYHARASILQKLCHRYYAELVPDLVYAGVGLLCRSSTFVRNALGGLQDSQLLELLHKMRLVDVTTGHSELYSRDFLLSVLEEYIVMPPDAIQQLTSFPLYPTKSILWDPTKIPPSLASMLPASRVLSVPKLSSATFLSFLDYLSRNFELSRLESAYEIRSDLVDAVRRLRPLARQSMLQDDNYNPVTKITTEFTGWAKMALELTAIESDNKIKIIKVAKPLLGQKHPEKVIAEIAIDLKPCSDYLRAEWDALGEHDVIFLLSVDASRMSGMGAPLLSEYHLQHGSHHRWENDKDRRVPDEDDSTFPNRFGVTLVRGCMILQVKDENGNVLSEPGSGAPVGNKRFLRVALDPSQYHADKNSPAGTSMYDSLNLVVRRRGAENNFKAVLETIRGLMIGMGSIDRVVPLWLQKVLLGHDPSAASYKSGILRDHDISATTDMPKAGVQLDFGDTFVSENHLRDSFAGDQVVVDGNGETASQSATESRKNYRIRFSDVDGKRVAHVESYAFPESERGNTVAFTPVQVEAIRSGLSPGLSVVVGPPGTGKTDVAVQIIASLYHSFPTQRTVIITHSNAALNDIFQKVTARGDVDERYLLRLGSGERDLQVDSSHDFTKAGRVAYSLHRRSHLLEQVQQLSESLGLSGRAERGSDGSPSYTCETAAYFYENHIARRIRLFDRQASKLKDTTSDVCSIFPFASYFKLNETSLTVEKATDLFGKLKTLFTELAEYRPLELLRNQRQRTDYLLLHQARVVAMTCTHAAIARSHLLDLGFEYDNVVIEEAGQMTEIETFIPLLLQMGITGHGSSRLKRISFMGDHNQLPPVIKNMTFATYSSLDQSMFSRLIKLGVPHIQLDKQGRARPEIAALYSWRYKNLGNLELVSESEEYRAANAGFVHTFQVINVEDFQGKGESAPTPYFFQNIGEAEYAVALFQYMVLIGYPTESISILTTYNGQRELICDILAQRCGPGTPLAGVRPHAVSTVDQYQGQQNNYIILSLVRTEKIGHLRDIRRLVVAVSRARLGLYVLCRQELFASHYDLRRTFDQFADKPNQLQLLSGEMYPTERKVDDAVDKEQVYQVDDASDLGSVVFQMQEDLLNNQVQE
ncbi:hypothetical protein MPSEU_001101000 [Mayamaea pseudoterrestris]|nr:hypothetical protein MPSEU_001101000 [Mayamaea pseudoterrestris]